jgi:SET domain-containing protein
VIDAARGDIAGFINHSCTPNCTVDIWQVIGEPRFGIFAGNRGVQAGDEVTINYYFMSFLNAQLPACYCGNENCSGYLGPKNAKISLD